MAHLTAPQLFSTTGRPETLARGNRCTCTLTTPALYLQTTLRRAVRYGGRLPLNAEAAAIAASKGGRWRRRAAGGVGHQCLLFFFYSQKRVR